MLRLMRLIAVLALAAVVCLACDASDQHLADPGGQVLNTTQLPEGPLPKGQRLLELDANPPEEGDYDQAMNLARELGAESIRLSVYWDEIEIEPGLFQPDPNWLAIADQYYSAQGFSISLVISVLDTTEVRLPDDLEGKEFSDPDVISRFQGLLDYVDTQLPDVELISLAIGNEIDGVLGDDPGAWQSFQTFYDSCAEYARGQFPGVPVSTKVTFEGLTGPMQKEALATFEDSEAVMITYYPLKGDFSVKDPEIIHQDFQILTDLFPDKQIHIAEIGYPSSEVNHSSQAKQAQFIQEMFLAWDEQADQIPVLSYSWLSDLPEGSVKELETYYGVKDKGFGEFLHSLGLRTYPGSGEDKQGFETFQREASLRGW